MDDELEVSFVPMTNIEDGYGNSFVSEKRIWKKVKTGYTHFAEGDIGIAKITPCFENKKSVIFNGLINNYGAGTTELHIIRSFSKYLLPDYLLLFAKNDSFISEGIKTFSGDVGQQRITKEYISNYLIPVPPHTEQLRIINLVNTSFKIIEQIDTSEGNLKDSISAIKSKILDLAVRGKLVPQNPDDEPASVLLERIKAEKEELIKQGKIKRDKNESVIFKGDDNSYYEKFTNGNVKEIVNADLFDIPNNWNWCMIRDIAQVKGGKRLPKGTTFSVSKTDYGYIRVVDMKNNSIVQDNIKYIDEKVYDIIKNYTISSKDLYVTIAGSIGVVGEIPELNNGMNLTENAAKITQISINKSFLCLVLQSSFVQKQFRFKTFQVAMPKLALERILTTFIPVPPIEEQERILNTVNLYFKSLENIKKSLE